MYYNLQFIDTALSIGITKVQFIKDTRTYFQFTKIKLSSETIIKLKEHAIKYICI